MSRSPTARLIAAAFLIASVAFDASAAPTAEVIDQSTRATLPEWVELLSIPNVATKGEDIQRNVDWLKQSFEKRGFTTRTLENGDRPMLLAELPAAEGKTTVLFYAHMDGQAVKPDEWAQASPWTAVLKQRTADGKWQDIPLDQLYGKDVDPEWRVFARSSSDDKAPIMMLLSAIDAMKAAGEDPAVNVKVLLDSEEEQGSPTLGGVIERNLDQLKADALVVLDGPMHESNRPTLVFGNRGLQAATLTVFGGTSELHSGHYGNYAPNPAQRLATLLASMKGEDGRVTVEGWYDAVNLDSARALLAAVPDDENKLKQRLGIAETDKVGQNYQEALQYPSLNVRGLAAATVGEDARTIIPVSATADIDIRTVPEATPEAMSDLLRKHVEAQGYHLIAGTEPTAEERAEYPRLASLSFEEGSASATAVRTDPDAPIGQWLEKAYKDAFGADPVRIRMMGGTVPTGAAVKALNVPFAIVPLVNSDNRQHSFDENMRVGNYLDGVKGLVSLLTHPF